MSERWSSGIHTVLNNKGKRCILLVKDGKEKWSLPGGSQEFGETPEETFARELREEIGCIAEPVTLLKKIVEYDHDKKPSYIRYIYSVSNLTGEVRATDCLVNFWPLDSLPKSIRERSKQIIKSVFKKYYKKHKHKPLPA